LAACAAPPKPHCIVPGCGEHARARRLCITHYRRATRSGRLGPSRPDGCVVCSAQPLANPDPASDIGGALGPGAASGPSPGSASPVVEAGARSTYQSRLERPLLCQTCVSALSELRRAGVAGRTARGARSRPDGAG
jgi:hypothetical protein